MKPLTEHQLHIATLVGTFGFLSTREIAKLAWPANEPHSAHVMAQTAVKRLVAGGVFLARDPRVRPGMKPEERALLATQGVALAYVLTAKGADILNEHYMDDWVLTPCADEQASRLWFTDGYDLSLQSHTVRAPVIEFCRFMLAKATVADPNDAYTGARLRLRVVGARGASRNFLGLKQFTHAQLGAYILDAGGRFLAGVHLCDSITSNATTKLIKLSKTGPDFFIVNEPGRMAQLQALIRHRAEHNVDMAKRVYDLLPTGGMA